MQNLRVSLFPTNIRHSHREATEPGVLEDLSRREEALLDLGGDLLSGRKPVDLELGEELLCRTSWVRKPERHAGWGGERTGREGGRQVDGGRQDKDERRGRRARGRVEGRGDLGFR